MEMDGLFLSISLIIRESIVLLLRVDDADAYVETD